MNNRIFYPFIIILNLISFMSSAQSTSLVPDDFQIPDSLENEYFRIRMLTVNDVVKDYDAVMTSIAHLQEMFPSSGWPSEDLTFEQDLIDLGWHQKEFQLRSSFAYTVVNLDESIVLGCLYINPTTRGDYDADISMWVRASELDRGLDSILFETVKQWVADEWPFKKVAYPGREISWDRWNSMVLRL